jgi:hypothetical protein
MSSTICSFFSPVCALLYHACPDSDLAGNADGTVAHWHIASQAKIYEITEEHNQVHTSNILALLILLTLDPEKPDRRANITRHANPPNPTNPTNPPYPTNPTNALNPTNPASKPIEPNHRCLRWLMRMTVNILRRQARHASCLLPLASCLLPLASCLLPLVSCLLSLASFLLFCRVAVCSCTVLCISLCNEVILSSFRMPLCASTTSQQKIWYITDSRNLALCPHITPVYACL